MDIPEGINMYVLDEDKKPIRAKTWEQVEAYHGEGDKKHVGYDTVGNIRISTVILMTSPQAMMSDKPLGLFETMTFGDKQSEVQDRYDTWEEAELGHKQVVERIKLRHTL